LIVIRIYCSGFATVSSLPDKPRLRIREGTSKLRPPVQVNMNISVISATTNVVKTKEGWFN
jgi:hypothetical protein